MRYLTLLLLAACELHIPPTPTPTPTDEPEPGHKVVTCTPVENLDTPQQRLAKCASLVFDFVPDCAIYPVDDVYWSWCDNAYAITDEGTVFEDGTEIGNTSLDECPEQLETHLLCFTYYEDPDQ